MCDISQMIDEYHTINGITKLEAAERMGINYATYKRKTNEHDDYEITVTEIVPFIRAHNMDFRLLDRIEDRLGRVAFQKPKSGEKVSLKQLPPFVETAMGTIKTMSEVLADGVIDQDEKQIFNGKLIELIQEASKLQAMLNNK